MTLPYWDNAASAEGTLEGSAWDYVTLGGFVLPGILEEPPKVEVSRKVDKKNGAGLDGATLTWQGYDPAEFSVRLLLWTPDHWDAWQTLLPFILPRPGKPPADPFTIDHPALAAMGVDKVMVTKVTAPEKAGKPGVMRVTLTCQHWVKSKKTGTTTPKKVAGGVPATVHDQKGGFTPTPLGKPNPPQPPSKFNVAPR